MPIWPVSFVDGSVQVADADGAFYPILMGGEPVRGFNPGWKPRGLQTGLPPYHVLELEHEQAPSAYWMLDAGLEFVSNAASLLTGPLLETYLQHVEPLVRNLFDEAVKAPHAAVPAAAHAFDGFLENNVRDLIGAVVPTVPGRPDVVSVSAMDELGAPYARAGITFTSAWVSQTLQSEIVSPSSLTVRSPSSAGALVSQERLALPYHAAFRFLDRETGLVFYLLVGQAPDDRHLYVPAASVVFNTGPAHAGYDPLTMLLIYYATHIKRAVMLPEAEGLEPGLVHVVPPPQVGLDEPPVLHDAAPAEPAVSPTPEPVGALHDEVGHVPDHSHAPDEAHEPVDDVQSAPVAASSRYEHAAAIPELGGSIRPLGDRPGAGPKQNWWQRLLGLGEG